MRSHRLELSRPTRSSKTSSGGLVKSGSNNWSPTTSRGRTTTDLTNVYVLSKASVIHLLEANGVTLRRQALTRNQVERIVELYQAGHSLAAIGRVPQHLPRQAGQQPVRARQVDTAPALVRVQLLSQGRQIDLSLEHLASRRIDRPKR
jgi:hypothetical protein